MRVLLLFILLLAGGVYAQEAPDIQLLRIEKFLGLNTADVRPPEGAAVVAHNVDLSRNKVGTVAKRYGFDKIDSLTSIDGIVLLEALQFNDGSKYMMVIGKDPDSGWGRIYVSNEGSENFEQDSLTLLYSRVVITGVWSVAKLRDQFYVTTSEGRGIIIGKNANGFYARPFPVLAPGEPLIVPFDTIAGENNAYKLNGTYRYAFKLNRPSNPTYDGFSYISPPIKVDNGRVYLRDFQWMSADTGDTRDTTTVAIFRTRGDVGAIDASDSAFFVPSLYGEHTGVYPDGADSLANWVVIDSMPDIYLSAATTTPLIDDDLTGFDENTPADFTRRYGAPGYITRTAWVAGDTAADGSPHGVYGGWPSPEGVLLAQGVAYACTYIDTLSGQESPLGAAHIIERDQSDTVMSYTLSIPRPSTGVSGIAVNLYRAAVRVTQNEINGCGIAIWNFGEKPDSWGGIIERLGEIKQNFCGDELKALISDYGVPSTVIMDPVLSVEGFHPVFNTVNWRDLIITDTVYVEQYKLVEQISDTSTTYTDTLRYDSLSTHRPYQENHVPPFLKSTFAFNARLYGVDGNNLYRSNVSDPDSWGLFDFIEVNPGFDQLTVAWPGQYAIRAMKALSNYNIDWRIFVEPEIVGHWGCIAPKSFALSPAGPIYLSDAGVVLERGGEYLEREVVPGIISNTLSNFNDMDPLTRKDARGAWLPREQQYWLCVNDTTFIWDWQATKRLGENVWTTSSITFAGGTLYDTDDEFAVVPGRSFYFWKEDDNRIYRYGQGITKEEYDYDYKGTDTAYDHIVMTYTTGPLLWNREKSQIRGFGLLTDYDGGRQAEILYVNPLNESGAALAGAVGFHTLSARFIKQRTVVTPALYYQIEIKSSTLTPFALTTGLAIEALDVYYIPNAERIPFNQ